ncbi:MAG: histidine phosphatase family protein [Deltaproteobacteria bacterium]
MRRRLILMRHAKSSWKSDAPNDHARPLNKRGRRAAPAVGRHLQELGWVPDCIVASDSQRTRSTAELLCGAVDAAPVVAFERSLYRARPEDVVNALREANDEVQTLLLLGHNPGWEASLQFLSGVDDVLKTADAALLEAESARWADLVQAPGAFELIRIVRAREVDRPVEPAPAG